MRYRIAHKAGAMEEAKKQGKCWQSEATVGIQAIQIKLKSLVSATKSVTS